MAYGGRAQLLWRNRKRLPFLLFLLPSLFGVTMFVLLPFLDVVKRSMQTAVTGEFTGVKNYGVIFHNQAFLLAVGNTLRFTFVCIPLLVLVGLLIAFPLSTFKNAGLVKSVYLFPLAMPTATIVLVWKMVFYRQGFFNLALTKLGEMTGLWGPVAVDYLSTGASFWVLVASYLWKNTGYTV
ncbi:MAG: sugar ABC transporter permease, partial [Lachnospiraceae bacterium]|nr:sugar ABC transporter permease [Lachnospiraceae bacterium]